MMKLIILSATATLGIWIAQPVRAATTREVYNIAKSVTARIDVSQNGQQIGRGSGFLLKKQGSIYSVITNKHVTRCPGNGCTYTITTANGRRYPATGKQVTTAPDLDLAAIEFTSTNNYPLARLGDSTAVKPGDIVYTSGFPVEAAGFTFAGGEVLINAQRRLSGDRGGYSVVYNAYTNKGMSGSAVFDRQGRVVAIHGHGDRITVGTFWNAVSDRTTRSTPPNSDNYGSKMGFNRGVSTQWLLTSNLMGQAGSSIKTPESADEFLILGMNKFIAPDTDNIKQDKQQALAYFDRSIQLQPNYAMSYFLRLSVSVQLGSSDNLRSDATKIYQLNSSLLVPSPYKAKPIPIDRLDRWLEDDRNFTLANKLGNEAAGELQQARGNVSRQRQQQQLAATYQRSLQKFDRAIQLYPKDLPDYYIKLNLANLYAMRGGLQQSDPSRAAESIADFKRASEIYPIAEYSYSYYQRGYWRTAAGNRSGAMADFRQSAILAKKEGNTIALQMANAMLDPSSSKRDRGVRSDGFMRDSTRPNRRSNISTRSRQLSFADRAEFYVRMAEEIVKRNNNRKLAILYLQQAAKLYKQDGNMTKYQDTIDTIRKYTNNEPNR